MVRDDKFIEYYWFVWLEIGKWKNWRKEEIAGKVEKCRSCGKEAIVKEEFSSWIGRLSWRNGGM